MMIAAGCVAVLVCGVIFAGLTLGGVAFAVALPIAWGTACVAFLLVCLVGAGAEINARRRDE